MTNPCREIPMPYRGPRRVSNFSPSGMAYYKQYSIESGFRRLGDPAPIKKPTGTLEQLTALTTSSSISRTCLPQSTKKTAKKYQLYPHPSVDNWIIAYDSEACTFSIHLSTLTPDFVKGIATFGIGVSDFTPSKRDLTLACEFNDWADFKNNYPEYLL